MTQLLIDTIPVGFHLEESTDANGAKTGKVIARGEYALTNIATSNKRLYRERLWNREIGSMSEAMEDRRVYGELDHPADGRTKLARVSHLLTKLTIKGTQVVGESEILDTPNGRILKTILQAGGKVGVSSRGYGSTKTIAGGVEEVQDDFKLHTFDFVADPATKTAYPDIFHEERQHIQEAEMELTLDMLKKDYPGLVEELTRQGRDQALNESTAAQSRDLHEAVTTAVTEAEDRTERRMREKFSGELRRHVERIDEAATERVRSELLSDPEVAGAKQIVERIASMVASFGTPIVHKQEMMEKEAEIESLKGDVAERELEVQASKRQSEEMASIAREATYRLHLERTLRSDDARDAIVKLIGDVTQYKTVEDMDSRVDAIRKELTSAKTEHDKSQVIEPGERDKVESRFAEMEARLQQAEARASEAEEKKAKAETLAKKAMDVAESAQLAVYIESRVAGHKDADTLRALCEDVTTEAQVDRLVDRYNPTSRRTPDSDETARVRARMGRGKQRDLHEDTHGSTTNGSNGKAKSALLEDFGLDMTTFDKLSGQEGQG